MRRKAENTGRGESMFFELRGLLSSGSSEEEEEV
jgi:hypothetical protein